MVGFALLNSRYLPFALTFAELVYADYPRVVFCNVAASPSSNVPGMPGFKFYNDGPNSPSGETFRPPDLSPNGERWVFRALVHNGSVGYKCILVGAGDTGAGAEVVLRHGTESFFDNAINYSEFRPEMGVNDAGNFAFASDTNAHTSSDEIAARGILVGAGELQHYEFDLIAREGVQAPGQAPGVGFGTGARHVHLLSDGTVAFISGNLTGSGRDAVYFSQAIDNAVVVIQGGVTVPQNQIGPPDTLSADIVTLKVDATGQNYFYTAFLSSGTIHAVNNAGCHWRLARQCGRDPRTSPHGRTSRPWHTMKARRPVRCRRLFRVGMSTRVAPSDRPEPPNSNS